MKYKNKNILLPEGLYDARLQYFDSEDGSTLYNIYQNWRSLCDDLSAIDSRGINLPEGLSEGSFALALGTPRLASSISGANSSFDCYDLNKSKRIQVKACSVLPDLTSFGPDSQWDEIYFCDFYRCGAWNGTFDIYLIPNDLIYNHKVNANQTLRDQQLQGRRPRFSIFKSIVKPLNLAPFMSFDLAQFS
jgi:hypothetical protein